ncbi:group I truncated hemoglobin [Paenibacillus hamazuiensis]|uniref:group I truncated hemoglobin n=1 Tax=Paenibacillus hamazuiensis TaxID=2936508 RepID=UPI00200C6EE7|nr:group 1 truncated hemoglobin [Paenibacillus hamazuiensis]
MSSNGEAEDQNLYQRLGGHEGIRQVVQTFYKKVLEDKDIQPYFKNTDMAKLSEHQTIFVSFAVGGPDYYTGPSLTQAHEKLNITSEHFDKVIRHLADSMREEGIEAADVDAVAAKLLPLKSAIVRHN